MSEIYRNDISDKLLGCLLQKPELVLENRYKLDKEEFEPNKFQQILYITIYNLVQSGCKTCNIIDIEQFLECYQAQFEIYKLNRGREYIETIIELTDVNNFESYYKDFKKLACLRKYKQLGFNIDKFWDFEKTDVSNLENIGNYSIEEIIDHFDSLQTKISKDYYPGDKDLEENVAGDGLDDLLEELQEAPLYGSSFSSLYLNTITRGLINGQLVCFSSPTGIGKTSCAIGIMCNITCTKYYDKALGKFVNNPCRTRKGATYIQYELDNVRELSTKALAWISGIKCADILDGSFNQEEKEILKESINVLKESNIHLVYMPNPTRRDIEDTLKSHIYDYGVDFLVYDYIADTPSLNADFVKTNGGVALRNDQILAATSGFLKDLARKYDIPVYSMTQCNANLGQFETIGVESIAGSRAVANKLDIGGVFLNVRPKESKIVDEIQMQTGNRGFNLPKPTHIYHMYKTRFSSFPQNCKCWVNVDLGTCRMQDGWITTWDNKLIKADKVRLERDKEDES